MAYLKPPVFARRVFNPLAMRFGIGGSNTLVVAGRGTGAPQRVPVIPVEYGGDRYLVSTRGESDWVRNLRAAGGRGQLERRSRLEAFAATELPVAEREPVLAAYRKLAGKTVDPYFKKLPDPADHPVFRIGAGADQNPSVL
jgi:deazaflavin-dependent oxidoreductase (nitroreductase family)